MKGSGPLHILASWKVRWEHKYSYLDQSVPWSHVVTAIIISQACKYHTSKVTPGVIFSDFQWVWAALSAFHCLLCTVFWFPGICWTQADPRLFTWQLWGTGATNMQLRCVHAAYLARSYATFANLSQALGKQSD